MTNFEYKTRHEQILVYLVFPNNQYTQHPPAVTTVATQTVRLEKNPKASRRTPPTVVTVDASRKSWLEWKPTRLLKQGGSPLCRCRCSRERRVV